MSLVLLETMRAHGGTVPWLQLHLDRMFASAAALGLHDMPERARVADAVHAAIAHREGAARVRLMAPTAREFTVEMAAEPPVPRVPPAVRAAGVRGGWRPEETMWQHKVVSHAERRKLMRARLGERADCALMLDRAGALGEADLANAFVVRAGVVHTAPAHGLLAGITRAVVMELIDVREEAVPEAEWRSADELFLTSAVRGVVAVAEVDGRMIGNGRIGPVARHVQAALAARWTGVSSP